jgi:hypothetical protein
MASGGFTVRINTFTLRSMFKGRGDVAKYFGRIERKVVRRAKLTTPITKNQYWNPPGTGNLERSTHGSHTYRTMRIYIYVRASAPYARFVHEGTSGPIVAHSGNRMPLYNRPRRKIKRAAFAVRGQASQPWLDQAKRKVLARYRLAS